MSRLTPFILAVCFFAADGGADDVSSPHTAPASRATTTTGAEQPRHVAFVAVDVLIDPGGKALACYEVEVVAKTGEVHLVSVEGGISRAFSDAPHYDPRALMLGNRVIIGAFSLAAELPSGQTRVARLHFEVVGPVQPVYVATLRVAGSSDETSIPAVVSLVPHAAAHASARSTNFMGATR